MSLVEPQTTQSPTTAPAAATPPAVPTATPVAPAPAAAPAAASVAIPNAATAKAKPTTARPSLVSRFLTAIGNHAHTIILVIAGLLFLTAITLAIR